MAEIQSKTNKRVNLLLESALGSNQDSYQRLPVSEIIQKASPFLRISKIMTLLDTHPPLPLQQQPLSASEIHFYQVEDLQVEEINLPQFLPDLPLQAAFLARKVAQVQVIKLKKTMRLLPIAKRSLRLSMVLL